MFVTFFDTCMVSLTAIFVWRLSPFYVFLPWLTIACLDGTFLSSALTKVPDGAWFTITLALILATVFLVWRFGKEQQWGAEADDRFPTSHFVRISPDNHQMQLTERFQADPLSTIRGFGIFFDKAGETTPTVFSQFTIKLTAIPEVMVFVHFRPLEVPSVAAENRHSISRLAIPNCYRLVIRYGYNDVVITPDLASVVYEQIRFYKIKEWNNNSEKEDATLNGRIDNDTKDDGSKSSLPPDNTEEPSGTESSLDPEMARLEGAFAHKVLYIIGKEQMRIKRRTNWFRKFLLHIFLCIRENTRTKMANLNVPTDKVIEVGFLKEI